MVPILISLLIDQMRGTSHESQTAWVGCLMENTSSRPHKRTNHPATQESESSCPTRERIILSHKRANHPVHRRANHPVHSKANHPVPQESESSCPRAHHQGRASHLVVVCCSNKNRKPPELNVRNMQDPCTRVSLRLQVVRENHRFDLSPGA